MGTSRENVGVPKMEAKLQKQLVHALKREHRAAYVVQEFICSNGIADVVVVQPAKKSWEISPNRRLKELNPTSAKVAAVLKSRIWSAVHLISERTGLGIRTVQHHLRVLNCLGFTELSPKGSVRLTRRLPIQGSEIAAFEVKVSDWRHGLYQAIHYRTFANRSVVVLPDAIASRVAERHKWLFRTFGIGLAGIGAGRNLMWYVKPRFRLPTSRVKRLAALFELLKRPSFRASQRF
jgi:DNA-binding transcriptional ArsR family regulator